MLAQGCLCWCGVLFQCQHRHWEFMYFSVKSDVTKMTLWSLLDFQLQYALLSQERMFLWTFMPTNPPWDLTSILGSFLLAYWSQNWASCRLCYTVSNTHKSTWCPCYVLSCPDCRGLQAYHRSRLLLYFILFILSKWGWWNQWLHITGAEQLGLFLLLMWIALGSQNFKTSFK